jgi:hypothetical protein
MYGLFMCFEEIPDHPEVLSRKLIDTNTSHEYLVLIANTALSSQGLSVTWDDDLRISTMIHDPDVVTGPYWFEIGVSAN